MFQVKHFCSRALRFHCSAILPFNTNSVKRSQQFIGLSSRKRSKISSLHILTSCIFHMSPQHLCYFTSCLLDTSPPWPENIPKFSHRTLPIFRITQPLTLSIQTTQPFFAPFCQLVPLIIPIIPDLGSQELLTHGLLFSISVPPWLEFLFSLAQTPNSTVPTILHQHTRWPFPFPLPHNHPENPNLMFFLQSEKQE